MEVDRPDSAAQQHSVRDPARGGPGQLLHVVGDDPVAARQDRVGATTL
jgi:hypothetical protein